MKETNLETNLILESENKEVKLNLSFPILRKSLLILRALNHPVRLKIIESILENGSLTVTEIYSKIDVEQSVTSQHLVVLKSAKIVSSTRNGKFMIYTINEDRLAEIESFIKIYSN